MPIKAIREVCVNCRHWQRQVLESFKGYCKRPDASNLAVTRPDGSTTQRYPVTWELERCEGFKKEMIGGNS